MKLLVTPEEISSYLEQAGIGIDSLRKQLGLSANQVKAMVESGIDADDKERANDFRLLQNASGYDVSKVIQELKDLHKIPIYRLALVTGISFRRLESAASGKQVPEDTKLHLERFLSVDYVRKMKRRRSCKQK